MASSVERPTGGRLLAAISNFMVSAHARNLGRGPTKARTFINQNVVLCVLQDTLTQGERSLVEAGKLDTVHQVRNTFQETMRPEFEEGIEQLTGFGVTAFLSSSSVEPDYAAELFVLDGVPEGATNADSGAEDQLAGGGPAR
jgi:uncharacterized protein YbcI